MRASPSSHYSSFKKKRAFVHIRYTEKGGVAIYWWQLVIMAHLLFCPTYSFGSCCSIGGRNNGPSTMFVTSPTSPMKDSKIGAFIPSLKNNNKAKQSGRSTERSREFLKLLSSALRNILQLLLSLTSPILHFLYAPPRLFPSYQIRLNCCLAQAQLTL